MRGDKSMIQLNGKRNLDTMKRIVKEHNNCLDNPYPAFQIIRGFCLLQARPFTDIINL